MGGSVFKNTLLTPRMPLNIYRHIQQHCRVVLDQYYEHVTTPIEAPKEDFGDVDFLVAGPRLQGQNDAYPKILADAFAATSYHTNNQGSVSFALPWPAYIGDPPRFAQVDVCVCKTEHEWKWERFHKSHGDMWNLLGTTIRKSGLTVNGRGLWLRIEEVELFDRKKSMILLTEKPSEVLKFLGMDENLWWKPFSGLQEMFDYAATCRMFCSNESSGDLDEDKKDLKHNDRQRMVKRPIFKKWIEEYIPTCRLEGNYVKERPTREKIMLEAFEMFGVEGKYNDQLHHWRVKRQADETWRNVMKIIPVDDIDPHLRAASVRGLRKIILGEDYSLGIIPKVSLKAEDGLYDQDQVADFVKLNWNRVGNELLVRHRLNHTIYDKSGNSSRNVED